MKRPLRAVFVPRVMGIFILLIIVLAFAAGMLRQELALVLTGAVFLALWAYCLIMIFLLALIHNRRSRRAFIRITPHEVAAGELAEAVYGEGDSAATAMAAKNKILQLPGILVRCRLLLATKDGRRIQHDFKPGGAAPHFFAAEKRGAYFSLHDEFTIFDILGFFRFVYRLPVREITQNSARLLVSPHAAIEPPTANARSGESTLKPEFSFQRTDNLIDHRPYVPGDDPRRINWKLFSHGGELFVREGEYEPPPQSNIVILVDSEYDPSLYNVSAARHGLDVLCETALAMALACAGSGMDVLVGYSGGELRRGNAAELAAIMAAPAASLLADGLNLPSLPDGYGVFVLALSRSSAESSALNRFLNNAANHPADLLFLHDNIVAEFCASLYSRQPGVRARTFGV